jgi:aspartyl aminopeptidase
MIGKRPYMKDHSILQEFIHFLEQSPSSWHAADNARQLFIKNHFEVLHEGDSWDLKPGKGYVLQRQGSICAFVLPEDPPHSIKLIGAHTDSPGFKLKPQAEFVKENMVMLGVEMYGAPLITSWLNRDLGIAGRVVYKDEENQLQTSLVNLDEFPVVFPQLAIHLDREVNEKGLLLNKQDHLAVLAGIVNAFDTSKNGVYLYKQLQQKLNSHRILSHDLFLYPLEKPKKIGVDGRLLASYRIDNLASAHAALRGLIQAKAPDRSTLKMIAFWDHEEIGSHTPQGAGSSFYSSTVERICLSLNLPREQYFQLIHRGICLSVDMTHALHPNYMEKAEPRHQVLMGKGIVIKSNAQYRYASDAISSAWVVDLCQENNIPYQHFVSRGDIPAGTTIGPIHAGLTGMPTVDIGIPQLSMHSCRELVDVQDHLCLCQFCETFLMGMGRMLQG